MHRVWGTVVIFQDPKSYINQQVPSVIALPVSASAVATVAQLGNVYLLLAAVQAMCCFSNHADIARNYLSIVAIADIGHIYACYLGMGYKMFVDWRSWNSLAWGNIGFSAFLCVNRLATVLGLYGKITTAGKAKRA